MKLPNPISSIKPKVIADVMFHKGNHRTESFLKQVPEERLAIIRTVTHEAKRDLLGHIPIDDLVNLLEMVDPDEATDMLQMLTKHRREQTLQRLSEELRGSLSKLLEFDAATAAGLMTLDYIQVDADDEVATVVSKFKAHEHKTGRPPVVLVMKQGKLAGFLPGHELGLASVKDKVGDRTKHLPSISYAANHDQVLELFRTHPHNKVAVLNDYDDTVGIIYSDDVLKLFQEQEASSLYDFAGINQEENVTDPAKIKVQNRYWWLIINLGTAFLAAFTVGQFKDVLSAYVLLAIYMPIVAGMGGNAATQTLAVLVRGISLKQIELKTAWQTLRSELGSGFINGLINGVLVAAVVILVNHDLKIALILAMAMVINLLVAAFFGTLVPLIMAKLDKDPASSATIFITTATDVLGFLTFLGLATIILR